MINGFLKILTWICYSIAFLGVVLSTFIFFKFRIVQVTQELNGKLAQKQIEQMRKSIVKNKTGNTAQNFYDVKPEFNTDLSQNQMNQNNILNETEVLSGNEKLDNIQEYIVVKDIVYINTSEFI